MNRLFGEHVKETLSSIKKAWRETHGKANEDYPFDGSYCDCMAFNCPTHARFGSLCPHCNPGLEKSRQLFIARVFVLVGFVLGVFATLARPDLWIISLVVAVVVVIAFSVWGIWRTDEN